MLFKHRRRRPTGGPAYQRGQGLVEFALIVPALFLILGAIIQFGIWFWDQNTLNQLVRDAGRYAATVQNCTAGVGDTDIQNHIDTLKSQTPFAGTYTAAATIQLPVPAGPEPVLPRRTPTCSGCRSSKTPRSRSSSRS